MFRYVAVCLLLFPALTGIPAGAAESSYHLVGTFLSKGFTGAVIITPDGKQSFYYLHEVLPDGAHLIKVRNDSISLKATDGSLYEMFISLTAGKLQSSSAPAAPAVATPQAQSPTDQDQRYRPARRGTHRSSSSED